MNKLLVLILAVALVIGSCTKEEVKKPANDPHMGMDMSGKNGLNEIAQDAPQLSIENKPELELSNIILSKPASWTQEAPASQMRIVQYACGTDATLKVVGFFFGQQDMIQDNIDRWKNEFAKVDKSNQTKLANDKVTYVEIEGTFRVKKAPMSPEFTETPGYMTLAAIVPSAEGPYYFKVNGPADALKKEMDNFKKFVSSYKTK